MRLVKRALHFVALMALLVSFSFDFGGCASAQQSAPAGIVGRWRSLGASKGGIGEVWEFRSDGTVDYSPGAVVEMSWRIEDNQLIIPPATVGGAEQKYTLNWLRDNNLGLETEGAVTRLARVGDRSNAGSPIVGEWIESREMNGRNLEARWLVYPGSKLLFIMPLAIQHGSYTISGTALQLKIPGLTPEFRFNLADDVLALSAPKGGHESHYARY
jgi:hypothetical protein